MLKKEIRLRYKELRSKLSTEQLQTMSRQIADQSLHLPIWKAQYYHLFLPIVSQKEVNTSFLFSRLQEKNKKIVVSKSHFETLSLEHFLWSDSTKISENTYGIPEPQGGVIVQETQIEVVFVPMLAYDKKGNRVGYGKGFYDRFLAKCPTKTIKVGLSFFPPTETLIKTASNDIALDYAITPNRIHRF